VNLAVPHSGSLASRYLTPFHQLAHKPSL
jgi:hypothetical protein